MIMTKKFLIQMQGDAGTRWRFSDEQIAVALNKAANEIARRATEGTEPLVGVVVHEPPPSKPVASSALANLIARSRRVVERGPIKETPKLPPLPAA